MDQNIHHFTGLGCGALTSDLMVQHFRLASDNVNVIRGIKEDGMAVHGHIIREIKARAALFSTADFVHENRCSNVDAHTIARSAIYAEFGRLVWLLSLAQGVCNSYNFVDE